MTNQYHLAQVNIAKARDHLDSPRMAGFVSQLDHINALAEKSPGFVWRLQTDEGDATSIRMFSDVRIIVNMSVWESIEALKNYVYSGDHLTVLKQRKDWFVNLSRPALALWWIPAGTIPTIDMARNALDHLRDNGPSPSAFTFAKIFPTPETTIVHK